MHIDTNTLLLHCSTNYASDVEVKDQVGGPFRLLVLVLLINLMIRFQMHM